MKDQYFGDENDFRKYGLLRTLTRESGLSLAVCWMLTPSDGSTDGRFTGYLTGAPEWERFDPPLFRFLRQTVIEKGIRSVRAIEDSSLLPSARFYGELVPDGRPAREEWGMRALAAACGADLVFFDPDNGMEVRSRPLGRRNSSKHLLWSEARRFFAEGHSLLVYQHFPRVARETYLREQAARLREATGATVSIAFSTPRLVFFLLSQDGHAEALGRASETVQSLWVGQIQVSQ